MFPFVLGCCDEDLQGKFKNRDDLYYLKSSGDNLGLLNPINQEGYGIWSAEYAYVSYHQVQVNFYLLNQG